MDWGQVCVSLKQMSIEFVKGESRAENIGELEKEILEIRPTHVMSFIGCTHVKIGNTEYTTIDYLEQPGKIKENVRDNFYSLIVLAILSNKYNYHYTYLFSGCIFEYEGDEELTNLLTYLKKCNLILFSMLVIISVAIEFNICDK